MTAGETTFGVVVARQSCQAHGGAVVTSRSGSVTLTMARGLMEELISTRRGALWRSVDDAMLRLGVLEDAMLRYGRVLNLTGDPDRLWSQMEEAIVACAVLVELSESLRQGGCPTQRARATDAMSVGSLAREEVLDPLEGKGRGEAAFESHAREHDARDKRDRGEHAVDLVRSRQLAISGSGEARLESLVGPEGAAGSAIDAVAKGGLSVEVSGVVADRQSRFVCSRSAAGRPFRVIDVGSGGGFPALIFAACTVVALELVEPRAKRAAFLELSLGLMDEASGSVSSARVWVGRLSGGRFTGTGPGPALASFEMASARAVFVPAVWMEEARPWLAPGGCVMLHQHRGDVAPVGGCLRGELTLGEWCVRVLEI